MVHPPRSFSRIRAGTLCIFGLVHSRCGHGSPVGGPVESTRTLGPRGSTACTYEKHMRHKSHCFPGLIRVSRWEPACGVGSTALYMAGISTYPFLDGKTRIKRKIVIRSDGLATSEDRLYTWADCTVGPCKMHTVRVNLVRDLRDPPHCAVSVLQRFKSIPTGSQDNETQFADSRDLNLQTPQRIGKSPHVTCLPGRH